MLKMIPAYVNTWHRLNDRQDHFEKGINRYINVGTLLQQTARSLRGHEDLNGAVQDHSHPVSGRSGPIATLRLRLEAFRAQARSARLGWNTNLTNPTICGDLEA